MKKFLKSLKRQEGFTLVELMVVVAIIGILSAVAIPNFRRYQAKAKISEAKLQLSALHLAQTSFYSDFNTYGGCLSYMGFNPQPEQNSRYYAVGFNSPTNIPLAAYQSATMSGLIAANCAQNIAAGTAGQNFFAAGKGAGSAVANAVGFLPPTLFSAAGTSYTAGAAGVIDPNFTATTGATGSSALTITDAKIMATVRDGY